MDMTQTMTQADPMERSRLADAIIRYGELRYQAGVAQDNKYSSVEHAARLAAAQVAYMGILRTLFPEHVTN